MKVILKIAAVLPWLLFGNISYAGEVVSDKPLDIRSPHCQLSESQTSPSYLNLIGIKGPIKSIKFQKDKHTYTYQISKSGKLTSEGTGKYIYDNYGRLEYEMNDGKIGVKFSYPDANTVISRNSWDANKSLNMAAGWRIVMSKRQNTSNGDEVCVYSQVFSDLGLHEVNKTTKYQNGDYLYQQLLGPALETLPSYRKRIFNESDALRVINESVQYAFNLKGTVEECDEKLGRIDKFICSLIEKSKEGGFDKYSYKEPYNNAWSTKKISWSNNHGDAFEYILGRDTKLSNGQLPHHLYEYVYDNHGNWTVKNSLVEFDSAEGIKIKEDGKPDVREIEYY